MNIFGLYITTKKKHLNSVAQSVDSITQLDKEILGLECELDAIREQFPFDLGQKVYEMMATDLGPERVYDYENS